MTDIHLIEIPVNLRALNCWAEHRNLCGRGDLDEGLALHHLLGETFGRAVLQPFRLMAAPRSQRATLFAYTTHPAESLDTHGVTPGVADVLDMRRMRSLPRPAAAWLAGQRLGFDLRVRPVVRLGQGRGGLKKGAEVDAFLAEALGAHADDASGMTRAGRSREAVYLDWLAARLGGAATLDLPVTRLARFQRLQVVRDRRRVEGPDAILHGTLCVTDAAAFACRLARGIGRHRAYGFGMLLLRPAARRC